MGTCKEDWIIGRVELQKNRVSSVRNFVDEGVLKQKIYAEKKRLYGL